MILVSNITGISLIEEVGYTVGVVILCLGFFTMTSVGCALMSYHLIYYLLSYYIRLLRFGLAVGDDDKTRNNQPEQTEGHLTRPTV